MARRRHGKEGRPSRCHAHRRGTGKNRKGRSPGRVNDLSVGEPQSFEIGSGEELPLPLRARAGAGAGAFHPSVRGSDPLLVHQSIRPSLCRRYPMSRLRPQTRSLELQGQLSLPLASLGSASAAPSRSPVPWTAKRKTQKPAPADPNPTILARLGSALASCAQNSDATGHGQRQRKVLTSVLSVITTEANGKRWSHVTALPPLRRLPHALAGEGRAYERRGSPRRLPHDPLVRHGRRAGVPALRRPHP